MQVPRGIVAGVLVVVAMVALVASVMYVRHTNGDDIVDQIHADMKKIPKGPPQTFVDQMKQRTRTQ